MRRAAASGVRALRPGTFTPALLRSFCAASSDGFALAPLRQLPAAAFEHVRRQPGQPRGPRPPKHVGPWKRANKTMTALQKEQMEELRGQQEAPLPPFAVGDKVRVHFLQARSEEKADSYEGVVLAYPKKGADTTILVRGMLHGNTFEVRVPIYSPLCKGLEVLVPRIIHKGKKRGKRVRRAKLYYLRDRDPASYL